MYPFSKSSTRIETQHNAGGTFGSDNTVVAQKAVIDVEDTDDATVKQSGKCFTFGMNKILLVQYAKK